jgi:NTE family protein
LPRTLDAVTGSTQILFHSLTREKLKATAPHILIRPSVGAFGAMDYFKIAAILAAAEPAKEDLKHKLSQVLAEIS